MKMPQFPRTAGESPSAAPLERKRCAATAPILLRRRAQRRWEIVMKGSAWPPEESPILTRRSALGAGLALTLAGCNSMGVELPSFDVGKPAAGPSPATGS